MMTSKNSGIEQAYVWIWLPGETSPVVAGKLTVEGKTIVFNYGKSYLENVHGIPIYQDELPLKAGILPLLPGLTMPGCIRDASPDAWGRRVILNKKLGAREKGADTDYFGELTYLLESGSDRVGALDFQESASQYLPRYAQNVRLDELVASAEKVEQGIPLSEGLDQALHHGSSIGGARPKALIEADGKKYIAKFSSQSDIYSVVKAEFVAMRLAALSGLRVAPVSLVKSARKDVLLVERFDRTAGPRGWKRHGLVSALTLLGLDEMMARYASYEDFAEIMRKKFSSPSLQLREIFGRMTFNILSGNTDDHARNHAALWDGEELSLTPAYDLCPQNRSGREASQGMLIVGEDRRSQLQTCMNAASIFQLAQKEALEIIEQQILAIGHNWKETCKSAHLNRTDAAFLLGRQFLNPYAFEGLGKPGKRLEILAREMLDLNH